MADGYGAAARPIKQVIRDVVASRNEKLPIVVWIFDPDDTKDNAALEEKVFNDERVGIALKRCLCLRGDISGIPRGKLRAELKQVAPVFFLYDPAGKSLGMFQGGSASARSKFYGQIKKLWEASFKTKLRTFTRKMTSILDKIEKVERKLLTVEIKRSRAGGNATRLRSLDREEKKLEKEEAKLREDEKKILADVMLKDEFVS